MTKPEERCACARGRRLDYLESTKPTCWYYDLSRREQEEFDWESAHHYNEIWDAVHSPCSCSFLTLPIRSGSKSEMPTPEEILERLWVKDLAVTGKVFFINGTFSRTFVEAKYVLT